VPPSTPNLQPDSVSAPRRSVHQMALHNAEARRRAERDSLPKLTHSSWVSFKRGGCSLRAKNVFRAGLGPGLVKAGQLIEVEPFKALHRDSKFLILERFHPRRIGSARKSGRAAPSEFARGHALLKQQLVPPTLRSSERVKIVFDVMAPSLLWRPASASTLHHSRILEHLQPDCAGYPSV
jgi:hypothetical protein